MADFEVKQIPLGNGNTWLMNDYGDGFAWWLSREWRFRGDVGMFQLYENVFTGEQRVL